jgi:hypothetical protein
VAHVVYALPVWIVVKIIIMLWITRLDRALWRFVSLDDLPRLTMRNLLGPVLRTDLVVQRESPTE